MLLCLPACVFEWLKCQLRMQSTWTCKTCRWMLFLCVWGRRRGRSGWVMWVCLNKRLWEGGQRQWKASWRSKPSICNQENRIKTSLYNYWLAHTHTDLSTRTPTWAHTCITHCIQASVCSYVTVDVWGPDVDERLRWKQTAKFRSCTWTEFLWNTLPVPLQTGPLPVLGADPELKQHCCRGTELLCYTTQEEWGSYSIQEALKEGKLQLK